MNMMTIDFHFNFIELKNHTDNAKMQFHFRAKQPKKLESVDACA